MARKVQHGGDGGSTTYLIKMADGGHKRVTVPDRWKVTFGAVSMGAKGMNEKGWCVRFYQGTKQQAVFLGCKELRSDKVKVEVYTKDIKTLAAEASLEDESQWASAEF